MTMHVHDLVQVPDILIRNFQKAERADKPWTNGALWTVFHIVKRGIDGRYGTFDICQEVVKPIQMPVGPLRPKAGQES